ncbi:MAG: MTH938/NDUFAF3 family protein [Candidatus Bathyarchaeota archaeon]|nr:MTH938/NDUFAF3 family protein [Candidatus Bathyarchaeota archaeon]
MKTLVLESEFGSIEVNGEKYENDIIIHDDGTVTKRKKKLSKDLKALYGHTPLSEHELSFLEQEKYDALYIGTGHQAALPLTPQAQKLLAEKNAQIMSTPELVEKINGETGKFVAIIHVTC